MEDVRSVKLWALFKTRKEGSKLYACFISVPPRPPRLVAGSRPPVSRTSPVYLKLKHVYGGRLYASSILLYTAAQRGADAGNISFCLSSLSAV